MKNQRKLQNLMVRSALFLFWPMGSFLISLLNLFKKESQVFYILFWGIVGYSRILISSNDSAYWTFLSLEYVNISFEDFCIMQLVSLGTTSTDFFYSLFLFLMSRITEYTAVFWMITSVIFAFFYVLTYRIIVKNIVDKNHLISVFSFTYLLFIPYTAFGVRFWFAVLFFIFAVYNEILNSKSSKLLLLLSVLTHFSFIYPVGIYLFYKVVGRKSRYVIYWYIIAILVLSFAIMGLSSYLDSSVFTDKLEGYGDSTDRGEYFGSKSLFLLADMFLFPSYSVIVIVYLYIKIKLNTNKQKMIVEFLLYFAISFLLLLNFYDALARFSVVLSLMTILCLLYLLGNKVHISACILYVGILCYGIHILVNLRRSIDIFNPRIFIESIFGLLSRGLNLPVIIS